MAIVTRNDKIIASIHFENERLIVRAITQEDADRILKIISVPYWIGTSKVVIMEGEEVAMHGSTLAYPGTKNPLEQTWGWRSLHTPFRSTR